jgi:NitT/TauT family transport system ATP-binding protein
MLKLWREDGLTVVFVTHSVYESAFLSTRLIVMMGRVAGEIRVTAPQVRTQEWRATPEFAAIARELSLPLRHAMDVGADIGSRI